MVRSYSNDLRRNDQVKVIAGKDLNKVGRILRIVPGKHRIVVEGISMIKRHTRPNPSQNLKGGIIEREGSIHISNVMIFCSACNNPHKVFMISPRGL